MKLEDIYYFKIKKIHSPEVFELAQKVAMLSSEDPNNKVEFDRRLRELSRVKEPNGEQRRQAVNFVCEMIAFAELADRGLKPFWVPEMGNVKTPDIEYEDNNEWNFVEVKHLNSPRDEDVALSGGQMIGGSVDHSYDVGIVAKIEQFIGSAADKYYSFATTKVGPVAAQITLRLIFTESIDAWLVNQLPWASSMHQRIEDIAASRLTDKPVTLLHSELGLSIT